MQSIPLRHGFHRFRSGALHCPAFKSSVFDASNVRVAPPLFGMVPLPTFSSSIASIAMVSRFGTLLTRTNS
jgi:hypothetical protein